MTEERIHPGSVLSALCPDDITSRNFLKDKRISAEFAGGVKAWPAFAAATAGKRPVPLKNRSFRRYQEVLVFRQLKK